MGFTVSHFLQKPFETIQQLILSHFFRRTKHFTKQRSYEREIAVFHKTHAVSVWSSNPVQIPQSSIVSSSMSHNKPASALMLSAFRLRIATLYRRLPRVPERGPFQRRAFKWMRPDLPPATVRARLIWLMHSRSVPSDVHHWLFQSFVRLKRSHRNV